MFVVIASGMRLKSPSRPGRRQLLGDLAVHDAEILDEASRCQRISTGALSTFNAAVVNAVFAWPRSRHRAHPARKRRRVVGAQNLLGHDSELQGYLEQGRVDELRCFSKPAVAHPVPDERGAVGQ